MVGFRVIECDLPGLAGHYVDGGVIGGDLGQNGFGFDDQDE